MNVEIIEGDIVVRDGSGNVVFTRPFRQDEVGRLAVYLESAIAATINNTTAAPVPVAVQGTVPVSGSITVGNTSGAPAMARIVNTTSQVIPVNLQTVTAAAPLNVTLPLVTAAAPLNVNLPLVTAAAPLPTTVGNTAANPIPMTVTNAAPINVALASVANPVPTTVGNTVANPIPMTVTNSSPIGVTLSGNTAANPVYVATPNPLPVTVPGVTNATPMPVALPGNNAGSPLYVQTPNPLPVSIPSVTAAAPLNVTLPNVTTAAPLPTITKNTLADPALTLVTNTTQYPVVSYIMNPGEYPVPVVFPSTPMMAVREYPTYMVSATGISSGNNRSMISVHNANNSTKVYAVQAVWVINVQQSAVSGVLVTFELRRLNSATAPTGGTDLSTTGVEAMDSGDGVAPLPGLTVRTSGTVSGESSKLLFRGIWSSDEQPAGLFDSANSEPVQQKMNPLWGKRVMDCKPLTLRAGQGLTVKCATNTNSGTWDIFVVLTAES